MRKGPDRDVPYASAYRRGSSDRGFGGDGGTVSRRRPRFTACGCQASRVTPPLRQTITVAGVDNPAVGATAIRPAFGLAKAEQDREDANRHCDGADRQGRPPVHRPPIISRRTTPQVKAVEGQAPWTDWQSLPGARRGTSAPRRRTCRSTAPSSRRPTTANAGAARRRGRTSPPGRRLRRVSSRMTSRAATLCLDDRQRPDGDGRGERWKAGIRRPANDAARSGRVGAQDAHLADPRRHHVRGSRWTVARPPCTCCASVAWATSRSYASRSTAAAGWSTATRSPA